ncbi:VOC family protein [Marinimicrobium sp. ABcell2]|uniref:VOC family protein n=1 Tax=Marinimicrobium sp. ABcell2 TaxID=3069751 RepID=UPI0027ADC408|nr:VOC family protein [Marinimicrobium sp. ABcell2]MDQ2078414.1 VOC family protein [Marinimicrobium sp. ABcell2]
MNSSSAMQEYKSIPLAQRLHIILLGVADVQKSADFYDSLGWSRASDSHAGFVKYDLGGFAIALISKDDFAKDANYASSERSGFPGIALIYLAKTEDDVKRILKKAVEAGGELVKPATVTPYGVAGYFRDPDGHLFEVDYEEKFNFTEDYHLITE